MPIPVSEPYRAGKEVNAMHNIDVMQVLMVANVCVALAHNGWRLTALVAGVVKDRRK